MQNNTIKLIAKPLYTFDKARKVCPVGRNGKIYLHITKCKYIGFGDTLENAIDDANLRTFSTGYRVEVVGA